MNENKNRLPPMMWLSLAPVGARNMPQLESDDEFDRTDAEEAS